MVLNKMQKYVGQYNAPQGDMQLKEISKLNIPLISCATHVLEQYQILPVKYIHII